MQEYACVLHRYSNSMGSGGGVCVCVYGYESDGANMQENLCATVRCGNSFDSNEV